MLKKNIVGLGLVLAAVAGFFTPLGTDIALWISIQIMGGYWSGVLLMYAWTTALFAAGMILIFRPMWFHRPIRVLILLSIVVATVLMVIYFAQGMFV